MAQARLRKAKSNLFDWMVRGLMGRRCLQFEVVAAGEDMCGKSCLATIMDHEIGAEPEDIVLRLSLYVLSTLAILFNAPASMWHYQLQGETTHTFKLAIYMYRVITSPEEYWSTQSYRLYPNTQHKLRFTFPIQMLQSHLRKVSWA